jgi:glyoxylase-like metal-dependent hydrolase (beta-lactamase superfamily II)
LPRTPRKKPASPQRRPSASSTAAKSSAAGDYRAKIRMYRQGLGDCFLISVPRKGDRPYHVMIDCGVILGTADPSTIMTKVVENIVATTGGEIDLLIATHEHWDHLSGFIQAKDSFDKLKVREVWLGWTEDGTGRIGDQGRDQAGVGKGAIAAASEAVEKEGLRANYFSDNSTAREPFALMHRVYG